MLWTAGKTAIADEQGQAGSVKPQLEGSKPSGGTKIY
jgi:hypothetical protein